MRNISVISKIYIAGSPFLARVQGDSPHQILVSGPSLSSAAVGKTSFFTVSNVAGSVEDIEVNVEGKLRFLFPFNWL
jgi:filamin